MLDREPLTYFHVHCESGCQDFQDPDLSRVNVVYQRTGFAESSMSVGLRTSFVRGSTAALLPEDGRLTFRNERSDLDLVAITETANAFGAGYLIKHIPIQEGDEMRRREVDLLYFTPKRLEAERSSRRRSFLLSKMTHPGFPLEGKEIYREYKTLALATLIMRGAIRNHAIRLTPTGAVKLVLEEDLFVEPWRWQSLKTYYVDAPTNIRQREQLVHYCDKALQKLVGEGVARNITAEYASPKETILELSSLPNLEISKSVRDRMSSAFFFVYDQLAILASSRQSPSLETTLGVVDKLRSFALNPRMRYDADLIFSST